jgi:(p)ppGpp synthase/HD superfamily hydrolase
MSVGSIVLSYGGDEEQAIAALLHDAAEDAGGRPVLEEIRRRFGERVARIVDGCTDTFDDPKPAWRPRKEQYIAHVRTADADTRLVSAADKLHNVREIIMDVRQHGAEVWQRFSGKRDGSLWYYRALVDAFRDGWSHPILDDYEHEVAELEHLAGSRA